MDNLALVSDYLTTYEGRDKFLKTLSYAAKLASGIPSSEETAGKFKKFGSEMSGCRVALRLLDDIPAWHDVLTFDWRRKVCYVTVFKIHSGSKMFQICSLMQHTT